MNRLLCVNLVMLMLLVLGMSACASESEQGTESRTKSIPKNKKPENGTSENTTQKSYVVNLFVENSGSMAGYVSQGNEFDASLNNIITSIVVSGFAEQSDINLYYINTKTYLQNCDIASFIKGIKNNVNAPTTNIAKLHELVLSNTGKDTLSLLVSDLIISPGRGNNASTVVNTEKGNITRALSGIIKKRNLAVAVYRLNSHFIGTYYDCVDARRQINNVRPFFIMAFGDKNVIESFRNKVPASKIGNVKNSHVFFKYPSATPKYAVQSVGNAERYDSKTIKGAKLDDGKYKFTVGVDLSGLKLLGNYLVDKSNYSTSNKAYIIEKVEKKQGVGTTHLIYVSTTQRISPTSLSIKLKNTIPQWISKYNIDVNDCDKIFDDGNMDKTYGIKAIMDAINDAYNYDSEKSLTEIKISINQ